jgi:hypothetical protein
MKNLIVRLLFAVAVAATALAACTDDAAPDARIKVDPLPPDAGT